MEAKPRKRPSFSITWARVSGSTTSRVLADAPKGKPNILLLSTGSEVALCVQAYEQLLREGIYARVISMPCWRLFETEDKAYRDIVLPPAVKARVSVEEGSTFGWERYIGENGESLGMHFFGCRYSKPPSRDGAQASVLLQRAMSAFLTRIVLVLTGNTQRFKSQPGSQPYLP